MSRSTRSSSDRNERRRIDDGNAALDITPTAPKRLRFSPRALPATCCDIQGLPSRDHCDACQRWNNTLIKRKKRSEIKSQELKCYEAWKLKEKDVPDVRHAHWLAVMTFLEKKCNVDATIIAEQEAERAQAMAAAAAAREKSTTTTTTTTTIDNGVTPSPPKRKVNWLKKTIFSQKQEFTIEYPASHELCHVSDIKRWQNDSKIIKRIREKLESQQYYTNSLFAQTLWSIALSSTPSLALSAAEFIIPCFVMACLWDTGIFKGVDMSKYPLSFPSDATLRQYNMNQAARDTMSLGEKIRHLKLYLSCDKGNKKGMGHFVKVLSWWDQANPSVDLRLIDIDASGGSSEQCALAIQASINKLRKEDDAATHLLHGQTTDSGGGGVLEKLYEMMQPLGLCAPNNIHLTKYLIANCCIHSLQIQLSNAVKNAFGEGALDRVNAMQMLHTAYRLQEALDGDEWRHILYKSSEFVADFDPTIVIVLPEPRNDDEEEPAAVAEDQQEPSADATRKKKKKKKKKTKAKVEAHSKVVFLVDFAKVYRFHTAFKKNRVDIQAKRERTVLQKLQAPILTRWWTVGVGSSFLFDYYLVLFHACQTVINIYDSGSKANDIASDLFSMMSNQENFVDITLIRCFHKAYLNRHLDWFQSCKDLTSALGFQSHNIAVRYYLMARDLEHTVTSGTTFKDYHHAVAQWNVSTPQDRTKHLDKLKVFIHNASEALHKHFRRWIGVALLPCGLMSEAPLARVVSSIMLDHACPTNFGDDVVYNPFSQRHTFKSEVHKDHDPIHLEGFYNFLKKNVIDTDTPYCLESRQAAEYVANGGDLRSFNYNEEIHGSLRLFMHSTYLALACHTHFVERFVKEAKYVSATDRSEEHRSAIAVIRASTPLGKSTKEEDLSYNASKIRALIGSATARSTEHTLWQTNQEEDHEYDARFAQVSHALKRGHFKQERIDAKLNKVEAKGSTFKAQNKAQQKKEQDKTAAVTGLIPYGKLVIKRNMDDLKVELEHRGVEPEDAPSKISKRIEALKELETQRLMDAENMSRMDASKHKAFCIQSGAAFKLRDT